MLIAQKQFTINAPPQTVWQLLPRVIYQCLPLEKMDIVDERTFYADLKWLPFAGSTLHLKGKFVEISPPDFLSCTISVTKGIIRMGLTVTFTLKPADPGKTEVVCTALSEEKQGRNLLDGLLRGQQRKFALKVFDSMRARLDYFYD